MVDVSIIEKYNIEKFVSDLKYFDIELSEFQIAQFLRYYELLIDWNEKINLTAITEYDDVMLKHFVDSICLGKYINLSDKTFSMIDVGTGAGFPGLALKIAFPNIKLTLLDSLNKRINFLQTVIDELNLSDVTCVHGRAEDFATPNKLRESFDFVVSRAVANLATLSEYCLPYTKVNGKFIAFKSDKANEEINDATNAIKLLGAKIIDTFEFNLPNTDMSRTLINISKIKPTPKQYPRKAGTPSKQPLH